MRREREREKERESCCPKTSLVFLSSLAVTIIMLSWCDKQTSATPFPTPNPETGKGMRERKRARAQVEVKRESEMVSIQCGRIGEACGGLHNRYIGSKCAESLAKRSSA